MKPGTTWWLIGVAVVLGVIVFWFDRSPAKPVMPELGEGEVLFQDWDWQKVSSVDFFYSTNKFVHLAKTNGHWNLLTPIHYPAKEAMVQAVVASIGQLKSDKYISSENLRENGRKVEEYGVIPFQRSLIMQYANDRVEILFGNKTVGEDEVFFQIAGKSGVYLTEVSFYNQIPLDIDGWRDSRVVPLDREKLQGISFRGPTPYGFGLERRKDATNRWSIVKPTLFRADAGKIEGLLNLFMNWNVEKFVTDNPREMSENYGLEKPQAEITFSFDLPESHEKNLFVQFGNIDITNTNLAYIKIVSMESTNVVLARGEFLRNLMCPWQEFQNTHLWDVHTNQISTVTFSTNPDNAAERKGFCLSRDNQDWKWSAVGFGEKSLSGTKSYPVDEKVVEWVLNQLVETEVEDVAKDVVTDYSVYGLDKPFQRIQVESVSQPMQQVDFGYGSVVETNKVEFTGAYVRRLEPTTVFAESAVLKLSAADTMKFPTEAFQLYPRDIMHFTTNDFVQISFRQGEQERVVERGLAGCYAVEGYTGEIPEDFLILFDEFIYRLGVLRADSWIYMGEKVPAEFGIENAKRSITIQYLTRGNIGECELLFSDLRVDAMPVAVVKIEGKYWVFRFPLGTYEYYMDVLAILLGRNVGEQ